MSYGAEQSTGHLLVSEGLEMPRIPAETVERLKALADAGNPSQRVESIQLGSDIFWVKRPEKLSLVWRLRKGDPLKALAREVDGYRALNERGLAAPQLVAADTGYFITRNGGTSLVALLHDPKTSDEERSQALCAAATALHQLHAAGMAHGRPNLKDILWDGSNICFIDFELFGVIRNMRMAQVSDLLIFALSCYATSRMNVADINKALAHYKAGDQRGIWRGAMRWIRHGRALDWLMRPLLRGNRRVRDLRALSALIQNMILIDQTTG